jgi:hypothetical protein
VVLFFFSTILMLQDIEHIIDNIENGKIRLMLMH